MTAFGDLLRIWAIDSKLKADEARDSGNTRAYSVHNRQAARYHEASLKLDAEQLSAEVEAIQPIETISDRVEDLHSVMMQHVHIHQNGLILCRRDEEIYVNDFGRVGKQIHAIQYRPDLSNQKLAAAYQGTRFKKHFNLNICPRCMVFDQMMKAGL